MYILGNKSEVSVNVSWSKFNELLSQYVCIIQYGYTCIFTDGSKIREAVGAAAVVASEVCKKRLSNNSSILPRQFYQRKLAVYRQSAPVPFWLRRVCKVFRIMTCHTLSFRRFYVACMVCYQAVSVLFLYRFLVMLDWQLTRRRILLKKLLNSYQCLTWLFLIRITTHSCVHMH